MSLLASGPVVSGSTRGAASVRAPRLPYGSALRPRRTILTHATAVETEASEAPKGTVSIGGLFAGLPRLGTTGTLQVKTKKDDKKAPAARGGRDDNVVFVAGATGRTGARVVRELLAAGFTVRAGARDVAAAESALSVAATYGIIAPESLRRVAVVPFDLAAPDGFEEAIGTANKIVCAVGAPESEALNFAAPRKIDGEGTIALVNMASELGVGQFVLVSSLGTGKLGWPAGVLNLFGGVLVWKREAEKALEASGMAYTIVRPGGMERPTDDYKKTHSVVLKPRDSTFGGQVSRLQVAELVAAACVSPAAAENKVLEVVAETTAAPRPLEELMTELGQDISREAQLANREAVDAARAELAAAQVKAGAAAAALAEADKRVAELSARLKEAKATEAAVKKEVAPLLRQAKPLEAQLAEARSRAERAALLETASKLVLERARRAAGAGALMSEQERAAIVEEVLNPKPAAPEAAPAPKSPAGSANIFGFFGKQPEPAGPTEEEKAAAEAEAAAAAAAEAEAAKPKSPVGTAKVFGFFGRKPEPAGPTEEEKAAAAAAAEAEAAAAAAAAAAEAEAAAKRKAAVPLFAGLFGGAPKPAEKQPEPEPVSVPEPAAPPAARKSRAVPQPQPKAEPEPQVVLAAAAAASDAAPEAVVVVEEPKPLFDVGGLFGGFMRKAEEQQQEKQQEAEPAPAPQPVLAAAAAAAAPAAPEAAAATPAPAPKPKARPAPAKDSGDEERRRRAVEAAKAALATVVEAAPAEAPAPTPAEPAPAEPAALAVEAAAAKEAEPAPAPAPAAAPEPTPEPVAAPAAEPVKAEAPAPAQEAAPAPEAAAAPAPTMKPGDYDEEAAARSKKEAQEWIAAWKAKQAGGSEEAAEGANPVAKMLNSIFV